MSSAKLCVLNDYLQNKELTLSHVIYLYVMSSRAKKSLLVGIDSYISMYLNQKQKGCWKYIFHHVQDIANKKLPLKTKDGVVILLSADKIQEALAGGFKPEKIFFQPDLIERVKTFDSKDDKSDILNLE